MLPVKVAEPAVPAVALSATEPLTFVVVIDFHGKRASFTFTVLPGITGASFAVVAKPVFDQHNGCCCAAASNHEVQFI